jgi:hypothetical protein
LLAAEAALVVPVTLRMAPVSTLAARSESRVMVVPVVFLPGDQPQFRPNAVAEHCASRRLAFSSSDHVAKY